MNRDALPVLVPSQVQSDAAAATDPGPRPNKTVNRQGTQSTLFEASNKLQEAIYTRKPTNWPYMTGPISIDNSKWLYPIPQTEIDIVVNKENLWQNPGY